MGIVKWIVLIILAVVGFNYYQKQTEWREVSFSEGAYSVSMPGKPTRDMQQQSTAVGNVALHNNILERNGLAYMASHTEFPERLASSANKRDMLDGAREGALKKANGTLLSETAIRYGSHPGRELVMEATREGHKFTAHLRVYIVRNRIYQVGVLVPEGTAANEVTRYLDSFKLSEE